MGCLALCLLRQGAVLLTMHAAHSRAQRRRFRAATALRCLLLSFVIASAALLGNAMLSASLGLHALLGCTLAAEALRREWLPSPAAPALAAACALVLRAAHAAARAPS